MLSTLRQINVSESLWPLNYESAQIGLSEVSLNLQSPSTVQFKPRRDLPAWNASLPLDWSADPFKDRNWKFQLHAWRVMDFSLNSYRETDDPVWLRAAIEISLDWALYHNEPDRWTRYSWYDMATGLRASRLAFLLDRILSGDVTSSRKDLTLLMWLADLHARKLQEPDFLARNNHAIFQLTGLDALCEVTAWRTSCDNASMYADLAFTDLIERQFTRQGVHTENSPAYHQFVLTALNNTRALERFSETAAVHTLELNRPGFTGGSLV